MSAAAAQRRLKVNAEEDASKLKFPPSFTSENADGTENEAVACLSVSEIKSIIETLSLSETRSDNPIFHKTNEYVKRFGRFTTETVTEANVLFEAKDNEDTSDRPRQFESAQLKNLCPETADEAKSLIPSLERFSDIELQAWLDSLNELRKFQA